MDLQDKIVEIDIGIVVYDSFDTGCNNNFDLKRVEEFKNKFFSNLDGKSTKRVVDMLINIPNSK